MRSDENEEVRRENRKHVQKGGHDVSTGSGPHTKAEPEGKLAGVSGKQHLDPEEHVHKEAGGRMGGGHLTEAGDEGAPAGTKRAQAKHDAEAHRAMMGDSDKRTVKGGRGITREHVEADHTMGEGGSVGTSSAEGFADEASSKANRKEAGEPEREMNEKAAMGRERSIPTKNTMGHGERETVAKHTI